MRDLDNIDSYYERLVNEFSHRNQENSPCNGIESVSIIVNKKRWKKRKKHNVFEHAQQPTIAFRLTRFSKYKKQGSIIKPSSMPELKKCTRPVPKRNKSGHRKDTKQYNYKQSPFQYKFIANVVSEHRFDNCFKNLFNYPSQTKWKIYRCQLGAVEDSCCCSCNSDAMFEVMKSLYDCYKAQNCDNCCCVLCSHKLQEERKLGEFRKSMASIARDKVLDGKTAAEKEKILNEMAKSRVPLPNGRTASEKALINKTRKELGLPPSPKNVAEKAKMRKAEAAGIITPLEGKTPAQKEEILRVQANFGLPLPEGRTASEKALIDKIKVKKRPRSVGKSEFKEKGPIMGARMRKAKADGFMTPLINKTLADRETILRELANRGIPLPEGQSPSEKNIIDKVRTELGLPIEPATKAIRDKHDEAAIQGILLPLEGKTPTEKESILQGQHNMGIPLPIGRTSSEKALIARIMATPRPPSLKTAGLLTSITGKSPEQRDKILRGRAMKGLPLPQGKSASEKKLIDKVRADLGLPKEPKTKSIRDKHEQAAKAGLLQPLEGKTPAEKEKILKGLHDLGIPLPEGRSPSEKAIIAKVKSSPRAVSAILAPSEKMRRAKAEGLLTPLKGKTPEQKERILKGLAMTGISLPEGQSPSEKKLIDKVRADLGLPKDPKTKSIRDKHEQAAKAGLLQPLEGKTPAEKEKILKGLHDLEIPLPEGRTPSEKALIVKVAASSRHPSRVIPPVLAPSELMRRAKAEGLLTPLKGKTPEQKEKLLRALANRGIPLPEAQTPSDKKLINKVRADLGLPKDPKTKSIRNKHEQAAKAGLLQPLEGKTPAEKENILKGLHDLGIPLPEGRTPSEKALIVKVKALPRAASIKTEGLMTPLTGKPPEQKEKILKALANRGIPLPEGQTPSEKKLVDKVRADLGLPTEPKTKSIRDKHEQAAKAGLLQPLEGKTPAEQVKILQGLHELGIPLPVGRTPSEKALIAKVRAGPRALSAVLAPSEQMRRAKAEGLLTPLKSKTPEQKEKILKALANRGIPLPEGQTPSEKKLVDKVRADLGLPKEPNTRSIRDKHEQAAKAGFLQPLEGKTPSEKENTLKGLHDFGIPLPEGRTPSEKALIAKVAASSRHPSRVIPPVLAPSEQMRRAKAEGLLTPLKGKTPEQKEKILKALAKRGIPLPEGQSPSEKKLVYKVRADLGLPKEPKTKSIRDKHDLAAKAGLLQPLEGKTPAEKEKILKGLYDLGIPLPEGRTPSEKALIAKVASVSRQPSKAIPPVLAPSEQMRRAKAEGLLTPLKGKTPEQKEKILKALAKRGIPLPEGQTPSEKKLVDKVRADLGLPKEPKTRSIRNKHEQAAKAGLLQPLEGKTPSEKEKTLKDLHDLGIPLPEGRTPSEKALIAKVAASSRHPSRVIPPVLAPSEQMRRAKAEGLFTPLKGKTPEQKEKILKALAKRGIPLPEGQSPSEKKLVDKVRADLGLPKEPKTKSIRDKHDLAAKAGLLQPLEGKTPAEKEKILKGLYDLGIPLPEGRTPSEKALIAKVASVSRQPSKAIPPVLAPSEQMRRAKAEGLLTPLKGKTPEQKEKILKALAKRGIPLPEGQTPSEKKLVDKVRADLGLPKEPKTRSIRNKHEQAAKAGLLQPLEGKTPAEKEKTLKGLHDLGIPLPEGRTPSEKALIAKVAASSRHPSRVIPPVLAPSEQMRRAKAEGLFTPLKGKAPEQKEKILKALAKRGIPLPEGQSPSEKKLVDKVRADLGLPKEPKTKSIREKHEQAAKVGLLLPLEGKTPAEKEKVLKGLHDLGIPLPEGRSPSEKALIAKVKASPRAPPMKADSLPTVTSDKIRKAKAAGLFTPLTGKNPEQKEKIMQGLAEIGLPLPEGKTPSEKALIDKIKKESGIPERTPSEKFRKAKAGGLLTPLEGKSPDQKEMILRGRVAAGLPLPTHKTSSEKALIQKIKDDTGYVTLSPSERLRRAKGAGLVTPLKGKTPSMKEKILRGMKAAGVPIPEGETPSEIKLISRLISRPLSVTQSEKLRAAKAAGLLTPIEGKTPAQKEKIVEGLAKAGLPLPEGKTKSEKSMIARVKARTPPEGKTPSEKSIIRKAKAAGLFTPITGKAPAEKERIIKGLAEAGLPLPVGRTASEKDLVKKIRAEAGLPIEPTPSEKKGKIRKKEKKVGVSASKRAAGIDAEEFQDIIKTTTCDRGCGCDKKKIKFKHSYVKIRVTSPDISSFCDCPGECIPGVKSGAFIDNEGIKVTIGSAVGIPSYSMECINQVMLDEIVSNTDLSKTRTNYHNNLDDSKKPKYKVSNDFGLNNSNKINYILNSSSSDMSYSTRPYRIQSENIHGPSNIVQYKGKTSKSDVIVESLRRLQSLDDVYKETTSKPNPASSYETILIIKNDMSLSTSTSNSMDSISLISVINSSVSSSSAHYSGSVSTDDLLSINSLDGPTTSDDAINHPEIVGERDVIRNIGTAGPQQYTILRMSQLKADFGNKKLRKIKASSETEDPIVLFNQLPSKLDVSKIMFKIMSKKRFAAASSIFIVVPMSDDDEEQGSSNCVDSITSIPSSEYHFTASTASPVYLDLLRTSSFNEHDERVCGKGKKFYMQEISTSNDTETMFQNEPLKLLRLVGMTKDEFCQISTPNHIARKMHCTDRACSSYKDHYAANVVSRQITPVFRKGNSSSWFRLPGMCKTSTESSACNIPPCFGSRFDTVLTNRPRQHGCSQQNQITKSPSLCSCPPDEEEEERTRSAKVQKPSIASVYNEGDTAPKKGVSWFRSRKTASLEPVCDIPPCSDFSSSPGPAEHRYPHGLSQQHHTTVSTSPCVCPPDDCEETRNPSVIPADTKKSGKSLSWFRRSSACDTPPCFDPSFSPDPRQHGRSQQNQKTNSHSLCSCPPDYVEEMTNRSAKVQKPSISSMPYETSDTTPKKAGKSFSWSRFCKRKAVACDTPPCFDPSFNPDPRQHGRSQQNQKTKSPSLCSCPQETTNRSAKVQKPSISSMPYETSDTTPKKAGKSFSWSRFCKRKAVACDTPPCFEPGFTPEPSNRARQRDRSQQNQTPELSSCCSCPPDDYEEKWNPSAKVQKPSIESIPHRGTPKKSGKSFSWSRLCKRKAVACDTPPRFESSLSRELPYHPRQHGRSQQNQITNSPSLCGCPPEDFKETTNRYNAAAACICPPDEDVAPKKTGKSFSWSRFCKRKASVACETPPCFGPMISPMPSNRGRQRSRNQQNQTSESSSPLQESPSIESMRAAAKKAGINFSWSRSLCKKKACDTHQCFEPKFSLVPSTRPRQRGCSQQNQTPASFSSCVCPPDDYKETRNPSPKVKKPSSIESLLAAVKKAGSCWLRFSSFRKGSDTPQCFDRSSSPVPPRYPGHHGRSQETQTPTSVCGCPSGDLKDTRNPSATVQKPPLDSIRHEGGTAPKKAGVGSGWYRLPCIRKAPAEDPEISKDFESPKDLESPKSSELIESRVLNERKEDKPMSPKELGSPKGSKSPKTSILKEDKMLCGCREDKQMSSRELESPEGPKSPKTSKLKKDKVICACDEHKLRRPTDLENPKTSKIICTCNEEKLKLALGLICSCKREHNPMQEPEPAKKMVRLSGPIIQQPTKLAEGIPPIPKTLASSKTDKENKPMSPKWLESPKNLVGQSKLLTSIKKSISKINETLRSQISQQTPSKPKNPSSPKDLKSPETGKQEEGESDCVCNQDKPMSPKELERSRDPKSPGTSKLIESKINETVKSQVGLQVLSKPKDSSSPKDLKSLETGKQKEGESDCVCNQDKPMSPKELESSRDPKSPGTSKLIESKINETIKSQVGLQVRSKPKDSSSSKDPKSLETGKQKERESDCVCNQNKPMSPKDPKSLKTSEHKEGKITCRCKEDKTISRKDSKSLNTSKKKEKLTCECKEESPKDLTSPGTSKQKGGKLLSEREEDKTDGKVTCKCKTEKTKQKTEIVPVGQPIPRQKRCPPQLPPVILGLPPVETPEGYLYEGIGPSCKWLDTGEIKRLRSELTQSTSGFKACKRLKLENPEVRVGKFKIEPPEDNIELDFGEAIRYFATMNPECFRQLMKEELESQRDAEENKVKNEKKLKKQIEKEKRKMEKARKKAEKEAKKGIINKTTTTNEGNTPIFYEPTEFSEETESVGSGWYRLPCTRKAPAKDPEISKDSESPKDLKSRKSNELIERKILSERKENKPMSLKELESSKHPKSPETSKLIRRKILSEHKEDKLMSPRGLESPKKLFGQSNLLNSIKKSISKINETLKSQVSQQAPSKPKDPSNPKDLKSPETGKGDKPKSPKVFESSKDPKSPGTSKLIESKILRERKEDKSMSPKELESPKGSKILKTGILKDGIILCGCDDDKPISLKDLQSFKGSESPKTGILKGGIKLCGCKEEKPISPKELESSKDPNSPENSKLKDGIILCGCNEDKPMSLKDLQRSKYSESSKTGILKQGIKLCGCKEDIPISPKQLESSKDPKTPETSKLIESKILSEHKEHKPISPKDLQRPKGSKSPKTGILKEGKKLCGCKGDKLMSPKDLKSPKTSKLKKNQVICACDEDKPMRLTDLESSKTSKLKKDKKICACDEDKPMRPTDLESPKPSKSICACNGEKLKLALGFICPCQEHNPIQEPEPAKKNVRQSDLIVQQPAKLAEGITPVPQTLASTKTDKEDKPMSPKELESSKDPKSPETSKLIGSKILNEGKEDKPMSPKGLESPKNLAGQSKLLPSMKKSLSKMNETLKSQVGQQAPSRPKDPSSPKDPKSPETDKKKEGQSVCMCNEDERISSKNLESQRISNIKTTIFTTIKKSISEINDKWLGTGEIKLRSELTQSTSGFKACKRHKLKNSEDRVGKFKIEPPAPEDNIELEIGDAFRYFATMNPEFFRQVMNEELESQRDAEENKVENDKNQKKK